MSLPGNWRELVLKSNLSGPAIKILLALYDFTQKPAELRRSIATEAYLTSVTGLNEEKQRKPLHEAFKGGFLIALSYRWGTVPDGVWCYRLATPLEKEIKVRKIKKPTGDGMITLPQWEVDNKWDLRQWVASNELCPHMVKDLLEEFRNEMMAKGKKYVDFRRAFILYVAKGYLSKRPEQLKAINSSYTAKYKDQEFKRGVTI